jgi:hypothetical protein
VAYGRVIMVHFDEVKSEDVVLWDVNVTSIEDDSIFEVPVF